MVFEESFMPRRNFAIIVVMLLVALFCAFRVQTNPYQRILCESMNVVKRNALEEVDEKQLYEGAMAGMMNSLSDEYSYYMPPLVQQEMNRELDAKFGGIGVEISLDPKTRELIVLSPMLDSPAYRAGVLAGDKVLRINEKSTQGMSLNDASELLRGPLGDKIKLTVLHRGEEKPCDLEMVRAEIHIQTVLGDTRDAKGVWNYFLPGTDKIAYVRVISFSVDTAAELEQTLTSLAKENMKGLILDLRDNPGGLLPAACDICDLFLKKGDPIVSTRGRDKKIIEAFNATGDGQFKEIPLVVLVNQNSASASEIVAACLQDCRRAAIVGQRSFGKGTVQQIIELEKDCGAIRLTTASYWRPSGANIHRKHDASENDQWGVQPDPECKMTVDGDDWKKLFEWRRKRDVQRTDDAPEIAEEYRTADRQLEKAVEVLQKTK
jgi:carboxyl-terminal processing protease